MLDQAQEVGRAGRDGRVTNSVVFWNPKNPLPPLAHGQNSIGYEEQKQWLLADQCRQIKEKRKRKKEGKKNLHCVVIVIVAQPTQSLGRSGR